MPVSVSFTELLAEELGVQMNSTSLTMLVACPICNQRINVMIPTGGIRKNDHSQIIGSAMTFFDCHYCKNMQRPYRHSLTMTIATKPMCEEKQCG